MSQFIVGYDGESVHSHILRTTWPNFTKFLCMLFVAVPRSSSGRCNELRTSGFLDSVVFSYSWLLVRQCVVRIAKARIPRR